MYVCIYVLCYHSGAATSAASATKRSKSTSKKDKAKDEASQPKPVARETVVFEATAADLQHLVIESPVPVLLDVYADWCGPCKQLTPMLEDMAMKSGGMFRVVKINSEKQQSIAQLLKVEALPRYGHTLHKHLRTLLALSHIYTYM